MAVLSQAARQQIWRALMRYMSAQLDSIPNVVKSDLQAAVDAADSWVDTNASSYNTALPATFRTNANATQKSLLLVAVVLARHNTALLRSLFGEID